MIFREMGNPVLPTIILLHGGGLSWWSLQNIVKQLQTDFHIIIPIIDGHGEDGHEEFVSIEDSAYKLIQYIDKHYGGRVYAIGGLSIGAQIVTEILSVRSNISQYAIIESALVYPMRGLKTLIGPIYGLFYGLIKQKWFAKLQAKALCVPNSMFKIYYQDSLKITKKSLINITISNGSYDLKNSISCTTAKVLIIVGEKERTIMRKSAIKLHETIAGSILYVAPAMKHGEISLVHCDDYIRLLKTHFTK